MKICVIGSHGTGKTTLSRQIANEYNFNRIKDVVPDAHRLKFEINENTPIESQFWIISKQLELERNTPSPWVSEKALWDNYVYGKYSIKDEDALKVIRKISIANADYDLVLYCPIEFEIKDDGLRSVDEDFQSEIDKHYRTLLDNLGIEYFIVSGNKRERLEKAKQIVSSHK